MTGSTRPLRKDPSKLDGRDIELRMLPAAYDGHRSVRVHTGREVIGLATATYSFGLDHEQRDEVAERIAALWNLHLNESTPDLVRRAQEVIAHGQ